MGLNFQSPSFWMLVNLTISADVCRVNKCGNNFLYLILIAPLYKKSCTLLEIIVCTFHWSLHSPGVVQRWYSFSFRFPLGYVWTYCKLFVTFNMGIMFTWIKTWWYRFALLLICELSNKLASSFFNLCWFSGIIFDVVFK